ncbi:MAG: methylmalonyl Co-A mutase-associated GTPase MeaB [Burkholderiaceae bacterium]|nr:methylmalonyl Co-A mutase-associated GTPase MeaB [Burkholderiaceae bacterium]
MNEAVSLPAILGRSRSALARAVTMFENERPGADELHAGLASHLGRAHVVGITGAPGAGKSTLIDALLGALVARGRSVAVVAVDPSSPVSGGAILGDRVRMGEAASHEDVFVRSLSSRGHLGGLSRAAGRVIDLFDAAGFDVVLVETVGTGQSEVEIRDFADTKIVVCPPGLGDEVQSIKAGILEIADILVVNKADSPIARRTYDDMRALSRLRRRPEWSVPVLRTVATTGEGIDDLVAALGEHAKAMGKGTRVARRAATPQASTSTSNGASSAASPSDDSSTGPRRAPAPHASDDELFEAMRAWRAMGKGVALATVVRTWGSSPRAEGSLLAVEQGGSFLGSVSGGCVEGAVISEAIEVIADGKPRMLEFGVSDEQAWEVGLACGGKVQVYVERVG